MDVNETTRQLVAITLGLAFVGWQASQDPSRSFAAILLVAAVLYAFASAIRHGVA